MANKFARRTGGRVCDPRPQYHARLRRWREAIRQPEHTRWIPENRRHRLCRRRGISLHRRSSKGDDQSQRVSYTHPNSSPALTDHFISCSNQVAPAELEAILIAHPQVLDAAVCGIYNEHGTSEMPVGYITTSVQGAEEQELLKADVLKHIHSQVARYKQITGGLHILPSIPRK